MPFLHLPVQSGSDRVLASDEPQAHRRRLSPHRRTAARGARPDLALSSDFIVGLSRRERRGFPRHARSRARDRVRAGLLVQIFAAPRHPGGERSRTRFRSRSRPSASPSCRLCCNSSSARSTPPASAGCCRCCSRSRGGMTASSSAAARICRPCMPTPRPERIGEIVPVVIDRAEPNSLAGTDRAGAAVSQAARAAA